MNPPSTIDEWLWYGYHALLWIAFTGWLRLCFSWREKWKR
jgi:hypothetical protein